VLRILNLPDSIQDYLSKNLITFGHAKALLSVGDEKRQLQFCKDIVEKGLSVRQMESLSTPKLRSAKRIKAAGLTGTAEIRALEADLQRALGTRVKIRHGKKRGKIEIEYYSLDDLDRVLKILGVQSK
jgi:ParB family chromosome partitioning protein